ncbi:MAG TPA: DUF1217 domain-containing protein [Pararhizobium sp.]|nr:DUF1217 domain-containing protein [Pararhizobium sp.]
MLSTLASFNLVNNDLQASLKRTAADPIVSRDAQYYRDNIGSVTSVDDFVDDYRLFSYAMKAYGLEDMTYAKAFMKKVLESDLSDKSSFANKLTDERYRDFAAAFNFGTDGTIKTTPIDAQSAVQEDGTIGLYSQAMQDRLTAVDTETAYYKTTIASITSVDDFMANSRLIDYALRANGIDPNYYSPDTLRKVLTSDLSDPSSFANQLGSTEYLNLAKSFNFQTDGSLPAGTPAQTADQTLGTTADYGFYEAGTLTPQMAADNTAYFKEQMASIASVDQLMSDGRLYTYVLTAFGFDAYGTDANSIRAALVSDLSDPSSFANTATGGDYAGLAAFFNFNADGSVPAGSSALSSGNLTTVTTSYMQHYDDADEQSVDTASSYFKAASQKVTSVDDLLNDKQLYDYVLQAYGIDPETASKTVIRQVLVSDPDDPASYVNVVHDQRYDKLAAAFNFAPSGAVEAPEVAQSATAVQNTEKAYAALAATGEISKDQAKTETAYYDANIVKVTSLDDFLSDERLVDYALTAAGIDPKTVTEDDLRQALASDLNDPKSYANATAGTKLRDLAATFNFQPDGSLGEEEIAAPQSMVNIIRTSDLYTRQMLENNEGEENTGVRLALYFERKAPEINSAYDILADPALTQVVQTALGISSYASAADVDLQAKYIESRIDISDFQDPDKVQKFLAQFASMYDTENSTATDPALVLLSGTSTNGISADLMLSIAQLGNG